VLQYKIPSGWALRLDYSNIPSAATISIVAILEVDRKIVVSEYKFTQSNSVDWQTSPPFEIGSNKLLSVCVYATSTSDWESSGWGNLYIVDGLTDNYRKVMKLASGYINRFNSISFPYKQEVPPFTEKGFRYIVTGNASAGTNFEYAYTGENFLYLQTAAITFTPSGAGSRLPFFDVVEGGDTKFFMGSSTAITSTTGNFRITIARKLSLSENENGGYTFQADPILLNDGCTFRIGCAGLGGSDVFTKFYGHFEIIPTQ